MSAPQFLYRSHEISTNFDNPAKHDLPANLSLDYSYSSSESEDDTSRCSSTEAESEDSFDDDAERETALRLRSLRRKFRMKRKHHLQTLRTHKATRTKNNVRLTDDLLSSWLNHTAFPHQDEAGPKRTRSLNSRPLRASDNTKVFRRHRSLESINSNRKNASPRRSPSSHRREVHLTSKLSETCDNALGDMWTLQRRDAFDHGDDNSSSRIDIQHTDNKIDGNILEPLFESKLVIQKQHTRRKPPLPPVFNQNLASMRLNRFVAHVN
mmetsp:Transcript_9593/g.12486  ORF Transcript_9593/g.12486 Transcript_9593/m.12486 type:complete len:267 (-) Transcript_9593:81-881(-)